jgi:hypothetical protein
MRRRQIIIQREELRRTLNTEQAETPVSPPESAPVVEVVRKRGRPRKVKDDDAS